MARAATARTVEPTSPATPTWAGLLLALGVPLGYAFLIGPFLAKTGAQPATRAGVGYAVMLAVAGTVLAITAVAERRPLSTIGVRRPSLRLLGAAVGIGVVLSLLVPLAAVIATAVGGGPSDVGDVAVGTGLVILGLGVLTSAVTEEIIFRGYALERLIEATGRTWLAAMISLAAFVAIHLPTWSLQHVIGVVLPLGGALTALYLWKRSLPFVIAVHLVVNAPLLALAVVN